MRNLYINEKIFSLNDTYTVKDEQEQAVYYIEGSFMEVPKTFSILNISGDEVALITKKPFTLLFPTFIVEVNGREVFKIKKKLSFIKARYIIEAEDVEVHGNWWDMEFEVLQHGNVIGKVSKEWLAWGDSYKLQIMNEEMETTMIALVVAINCVKAVQEEVFSWLPI